ncbi:uncharacterized protein L3040_006324 [Drepanopeziza brunnea f. sp. 'multigermtubi']|uniref:uncharacterized protein n=1 Tax=Drepanopeziza brunnea f. sp. 'multigermtubi' TaxID=698441 RepID=UPI0023A141BA|nr:hypothetical protein L3040_006324 [Drepanopeziza brunnea f. sp. 'multigermtubi']
MPNFNSAIGCWRAPGRRSQLFGIVVLLSLCFYLMPWSGIYYSLPSYISKHTSTSIASPPSLYDPTKLAFLVETRPLPHLPALFAHMTSIIPPEWTFKFMGGLEAHTFMRASPTIARMEAAGKLTFIDIPANYSLKSRQTISEMFTDPHLYGEILHPAEHLLVWQPDSIFCANAPTTINDFLDWDWVGAPWGKNDAYGGNGGLSLRKVSRIMDVLVNKTRKHGDGALEDLWLCRELHALPGQHMPNASVSKTFSVESVWDDRPLGYHIGWMGVHHEQIWDKPEQVDHIMEYCPEVSIILGMNLTGDKPGGIA